MRSAPPGRGMVNLQALQGRGPSIRGSAHAEGSNSRPQAHGMRQHHDQPHAAEGLHRIAGGEDRARAHIRADPRTDSAQRPGTRRAPGRFAPVRAQHAPVPRWGCPQARASRASRSGPRPPAAPACVRRVCAAPPICPRETPSAARFADWRHRPADCVRPPGPVLISTQGISVSGGCPRVSRARFSSRTACAMGSSPFTVSWSHSARYAMPRRPARAQSCSGVFQPVGVDAVHMQVHPAFPFHSPSWGSTKGSPSSSAS